MNNFNGQINISRDLRQNKQTVIGKYDLTDILFLFMGISIAIIVAYVLGFSEIKIFDEFTAIIISLIPMILIISLGFRKVAGMRQIDYIRMRQIDKRSNVRIITKNDRLNNGDKYLIPLEIKDDYLDEFLNEFLSIDNIKRIQIRYERNRVIAILDKRYSNKEYESENLFLELYSKFYRHKGIKYLASEEIYLLETLKNLKFINKNSKGNKQLTYKKDNMAHDPDIDKLYLELKRVLNKNVVKDKSNIYDEFPNESYLEIVTNTNIKDIIKNLLLLRLKIKQGIFFIKKAIRLKINQFRDKYQRYVSIENIVNSLSSSIDLNNKELNTENLLKYEIYMLHIYKNESYKDFIKEIKKYVDVISYYKKDDEQIYLNTYLIVKKDEKSIELVNEVLNKYSVIVNRLTKHQNLGVASVSYLMTNLVNAYRVYK